MSEIVDIQQGDSPIVLGLPHTGTWMPDEVFAQLNETGRAISDTDWHIHRLYDGLIKGATTVRALFHRYAIDANRDPSGASLYPGQNTTGLCPTTDFDGVPLYDEGDAPDEAEVARRRELYHTPYHAALAAEIARVKAIHGYAILYDCHSIRSVIPFLFPGVLPDFNIGTNHGATCDPGIEAIVRDTCAEAEGFTSVLNGRFVGGWTTRHYGQPGEGVHAIQMELAQARYMTESPPWDWDEAEASRTRKVLKTILDRLNDWRPA